MFICWPNDRCWPPVWKTDTCQRALWWSKFKANKWKSILIQMFSFTVIWPDQAWIIIQSRCVYSRRCIWFLENRKWHHSGDNLLSLFLAFGVPNVILIRIRKRRCARWWTHVRCTDVSTARQADVFGYCPTDLARFDRPSFRNNYLTIDEQIKARC